MVLIKNKTKSLSQFFTKDQISKYFVQEVFSTLKKENFDLNTFLFIEPSAGYGCFLDNIKEKKFRIKAYDIDPKKAEIEKKDFLIENLNIRQKQNIIIIGNPPFGKYGKTALDFVNKSFEYAEFVCFILPNNFQKYSMQRLLSPDIKIIYQKNLPKNSFYTEENENVDIGCVFQIFTKEDTKQKDKRIRERPPITHKDFILYQYNNTKEALKYFRKDFDIAIFSQGYGKYPTFKTKAKDCDKKKQWLLVKCKNKKVLSNIKKMNLEKLANKNTTVKGFRKADFVLEYIKLYGK